MAVTITALFAHISAAGLAMLLQPASKGDTFLDRWWGPASHVRLFAVKRTEVQTPLTWGCVVTARIALAVSVVSLMLDLCIN